MLPPQFWAFWKAKRRTGIKHVSRLLSGWWQIFFLLIMTAMFKKIFLSLNCKVMEERLSSNKVQRCICAALPCHCSGCPPRMHLSRFPPPYPPPPPRAQVTEHLRVAAFRKSVTKEALEDGHRAKWLKTEEVGARGQTQKCVHGEFEKQDHRTQSCHLTWVPEKTESLKGQESAHGGNITDVTWCNDIRMSRIGTPGAWPYWVLDLWLIIITNTECSLYNTEMSDIVTWIFYLSEVMFDLKMAWVHICLSSGHFSM